MKFEITKQFSFDDVQQMDIDLDFVNLDLDKQIKLLNQLRELLKDQSNQVLFDHRYDYTRLFVLLAWDRLNSLSQDEVIWLLAEAPIEAIVFDIDVWKELMWYCNGLFASDVDALEQFYTRVRESFFQSDTIIGEQAGGQPLYLKNLIGQIEKDERQHDTLQSAELYSRIERMLFPEKDREFFTAYVERGHSEIVRQIIGLINFFIGVKPEDIHYVLNAFVNNLPLTTDNAQELDQSMNSNQDKAADESVVSESIYHDVQEELEIQFRYDSQGELQPIEEVLTKLSEYAQKYNDPRIEELYYFDEGEGKFVWNSELLK